jgi:CRP-like cAMP-binding protein
VYEPDEKNNKWLDPMISYINTAETGIAKIKKKIKNYTNDVHWNMEELFSGLMDMKFLSQDQLSKMKKLFLKKMHRNHFTMTEAKYIDKALSNIPFFLKFDLKTRLLLIANSEFVEYQTGDCVFHQGDSPDNMYVILYGSVNVVLKKENATTGLLNDYVIANMSDGFAFGEYSMLATNKSDRAEAKAKIAQVHKDQSHHRRRSLMDTGVKGPKLQTSPNLSPIRVPADTGSSGREISTKERELMKKSGFSNPAKQYEDKLFAGNIEKGKPVGFQQKIEAKATIVRKKTIFNKAVGPVQGGRAATIKVVESCCLLQIDQGFFQKVIMTIIKPELDEKISL